MVTLLFMRLVNAEEKSLDASIFGRRATGVSNWGVLVERSPLDAESGGLKPGDDVVDRRGVARFAFDLDHRVLGRQPGEDAAVVDLDDVDARFVNLCRDRRERAGLI